MKHLALILAAALAAGCTTPIPQGGPKAEADRGTGVAVEDRPDGFVVSVAYSRYQFIPETQAVLAACRSQLLAAAHDVAAQRRRAIEPVNEQRVRISTGRNGLTGMTSCEASVPVTWKQ
jgi:hypothetical protein